MKRKLPKEVHVIHYGEDHWHYNKSIKYDEIIDFVKSHKGPYVHVLQKFGISRNLLKRVLREHGMSIETFIARYCTQAGMEGREIIRCRVEESDAGT